MGIDVIAIGIPTVVETAVLVNDCLDLFIEKLQSEAKSNEYLNKLREEDNYEEIKEALIPKKIYIHLVDNYIDDFINTLKLIFENRIILCTDCNICRVISQKHSNKYL